MLRVNTCQQQNTEAHKSWERHVVEGRKIVNDNWKLGAIVNDVMKAKYYGEKTLNKFAKEVGCSPSSLYTYGKVAEKISDTLKSEYGNILGFYHFYALITNDVPPNKYKYFLEKAVEKNLSIGQLQNCIRKELSDEDNPVKPLTIKFPPELRETINECFEELAEKFAVSPEINYAQNKDVLTGFVFAAKDFLKI